MKTRTHNRWIAAIARQSSRETNHADNDARESQLDEMRYMQHYVPQLCTHNNESESLS